ncbi:pentapeptide repeat-containing protein [Nocardia suismassiliense]|uniref:pentapeptide repeat-containing protein n=1 Tax=Nocardia suismassiliense TaxID=2077092 RepID=UPI000D1F5E38|nr:pentapeptide repeat-containing protein [Nocardia suismassiliense]
MSAGKNAVIRPAAGNRIRRWSATHRRSIWTGLALAGASGAGFAAAVLAGVSPAFGQPLATLLAGAGVLAAGILAYLNGERTRDLTKRQHEADAKRERERHQTDTDRERERHAEDSRRTLVSDLRDRYTAIAAQIADTNSAAIRQAGVYALTALADDWHAFGEDDERQVCINLLQWYLRVPFPVGDDPTKPDLSEREIRQTIVAILAERRRRPADHPKSWATAAISLHQASLPGCTFLTGNLADLNFSGADLTGANLNSANLNSTHLNLTILNNADLARAKLIKANLAGANLTNATLAYARLNNANLWGANLTNATLTYARLGGADLTNANLDRARLNGARLNGARLNGADLTGAKLANAQLFGITYDETTQWPEGIISPQPDA